MEKDNLNTQEWWNAQYGESGFYQDRVITDWQLWHDFLLKALPKKPSRILEVACGLAHNAKFAAEQGHFIVATDQSEIAIEENKIRFADKNIQYRCMELDEAISIFKNFDAIMAFEIIEHFKNPEIPLLQIYKSLAENGIFIFSVPHEEGKHAYLNLHYCYWNYNNTVERMFHCGFKKVLFFKDDFYKEHIMGVATK